MNLDGILVIDKPEGWTSHDVVAKLRGVMGMKRIGHGGTLDPMATGVLPIFVGRATKYAQFSASADKEYIAGLRFGIVTDTQDITGKVLVERDTSVTAAELKSVLPCFLGRQKQIPPMYSAIKKDGKKLYELARQGVEVDRPPRDIEIFDIEIKGDGEEGIPTVGGSVPDALENSDVYLRIACSKGTYIRTLCHDIGQVLGCGAAMSYLRRTRAGEFTIDIAHTLDTVISHKNPVDLLFSVGKTITEV